VPSSTLALRSTMRIASVGLFIQGTYIPREPKMAVNTTVTWPAPGVAPYTIVGLALRAPVSYNGINNQVEALLTSVNVASNITGGSTPVTTLQLILNPYINRTSAGIQWKYVAGAAVPPYGLSSPWQFATTDTTGAVLNNSIAFTGGTLLRAVSLAANTSITIDMVGSDLTLQAEDVLVFQLLNDGATTASSAGLTVTWVEAH